MPLNGSYWDGPTEGEYAAPISGMTASGPKLPSGASARTLLTKVDLTLPSLTRQSVRTPTLPATAGP